MGAAGSVLIIGGGLAGLAAALEAARRGHAVTLVEAGEYGRDKVCGEFLSPEASRDFEALGCGDWADALGARPMRSVMLAAGSVELPVPTGSTEPGRSVTRRALEAWLVERAERAGVRVITGAPVARLAATRSGFRAELGARARGQVLEAAHVIAAVGKRSTLDAALDLPRAARREPFAAAKAYFAPNPAALPADVVLHLLDDGSYVGLNPVEDGRVALCALLAGGATSSWPVLRERFGASPALGALLDRLGEPLGAVKGLFGFGFGLQRRVAAVAPDEASSARARPALLCGDAARMMPPFTGDGMAVALRSGALAARSLSAHDPAAAYARAHVAEFTARSLVAGALHHAFLRASLFRAIAPALARRPRVVQRLYEATRGA